MRGSGTERTRSSIALAKNHGAPIGRQTGAAFGWNAVENGGRASVSLCPSRRASLKVGYGSNFLSVADQVPQRI